MLSSMWLVSILRSLIWDNREAYTEVFAVDLVNKCTQHVSYVFMQENNLIDQAFGNIVIVHS